MNDFKQQFSELLKKNNLSASEALQILKNENLENEDEEIKKIVESHENLVGKCFVTTTIQTLFPIMKRYIKVISARSENPYRVECLCFEEHPTYWFDYQSHKMRFAGDYYLGTFEFDSIVVDSLMADVVMKMDPISTEEYNNAMRQYIEELTEMKWSCDHYRMGNKMPSDVNWEIKE